MVNTSAPYARYGLEYRLNENTHLWVYLIPYLAWKIQHNLIENENDFIAIKDELHSMHYQGINSRPYAIDVEKNNALHTKVGILKDMVKEHINVYEMAWLYDWNEEELEIFKAYIDEDIEKYESLIYTDELNNVRQQVYEVYKRNRYDDTVITVDKDAFNNWVANEASRFNSSENTPYDVSLRDELIRSTSNTYLEDVITNLFELLDTNTVHKVRLLLPMTNDNKFLKDAIKSIISDVKFVRKTSTPTLTSDTVVITDNTFIEYNCNVDNVISVLTI